MKRIAFIVSAPSTADTFLRGHIIALSESYEVDLIANFPKGYETSMPVNQKIHVTIYRNINVWFDLLGLITLIRVFASNRYDAVHSVTPKAGLLAMTAAWIARIPIRHHTFTGQVWATKIGLFRWFLRLLDKVVHHLSTNCLIDSHSQRDFLLNEKVVLPEKSFVLASGSISGVNIERFRPDPDKRRAVREQHGLTCDDFVFLFVGRINDDKGLPELVSAFSDISSKYPSARLMVVGPDESGMFENGALDIEFREKFIHVGYTKEPEAYFNAADVVCLPSHREGFGSVLIEAAACGIPGVASNIYGISDAIIDGWTGLLHTARSNKDLVAKMDTIISQPKLRRALADNAIERARREFSSSILEQALVQFYLDAFSKL